MITTTVFFLILFSAITGALNALLSYLLDYCFFPTSIFGRWIPFLSSLLTKKDKLGELSRKRILNHWTDEEYENALIDSVSHHFFFKILGGCVICTNIWISFITFAILYIYTDVPLWCFPIHTLVSSFTIRKINTE